MLRLLLLAVAMMVPAPVRAAFSSDRIAVTVEGKGPDVVLIHGLGSNARVWDGAVTAVPGYRYHKVQVLGFGGAPNKGNVGQAGDPAIAPVVEEIARYIETQKLAKPAVVGHSLGGMMGMMLASRHPADVGRLMIVDMLPFTGGMFGGNTVEAVRPMVEAIFAQMDKATPEQRDAFLTQTINGMVNTEAMRAGVLAESKASDADFVKRTYQEIMLTDLRPELAKIAVPTTVLYVKPAAMSFTDAQMATYYAGSYANLKGAKLVRIPDSAHFIMFDQPARFATELQGFLTAK